MSCWNCGSENHISCTRRADVEAMEKRVSEGAAVPEAAIATTVERVLLTGQAYMSLRNTVRVIRGSGVKLSPEREEQVKKWEAAIRKFEEEKMAQYESVRGRKA